VPIFLLILGILAIVWSGSLLVGALIEAQAAGTEVPGMVYLLTSVLLVVAAVCFGFVGVMNRLDNLTASAPSRSASPPE
jgi:drug/metabolite transporter (DMT)-like permease